MGKKWCYTIVLSFFCIFFLPIHYARAAEELVKSSSNPLAFSGSYPQWQETGQFQSSLLFENSTYKLWYSSLSDEGIKIGYATSLNGTEWTRNTLMNVEDGYDNHDPSILREADGLDLYFAASQNGTNYHISKVHLTDESHPDGSTLKTIITSEQPWETTAVSSPFVYKENGTYFLFYVGSAGSGWNLGLTTSPDGQTWTKCVQNPVLTDADAAALKKQGDTYTLYFHSVSGTIQAVDSTDSLSCESQWKNRRLILSPGPGGYDATFVSGASIIEVDGISRLYYSGRSTDYKWTINLAVPSLTPTVTPSPSPTPTETPTPTPTATPTPTPKQTIVILPGLLASWNREAILHNHTVKTSDWKLLPTVTEYEGLLKTLQKKGYVENSDYYMFPYDWRQGVEKSAEDLDSFLRDHHLLTNRVILIGHSLGGLVSRIYTQRHPETVEKLITIGSPHQGTALAYKLVEGGELDLNNSLEWLASEIVLQLNKNRLMTNRQVIAEKMPSSIDLFPTYRSERMSIKNRTLLTYNRSVDSVFPKLQTIAGMKGKTLHYYNLGPQTPLDRLLDLYPDGRPTKPIYQEGDFTITRTSASLDTDFTILPADHSELMWTKQGVKTVLKKADISIADDDIVEGKRTEIMPSILVLVQSPVTVSLTREETTHTDEEGMIFLPGAQPGDYELSIRGIDRGDYHIQIATVSEKGSGWTMLSGRADIGKQQTIKLRFDPDNPEANPLRDPEDLIQILKNKLDLVKGHEREKKKIVSLLTEAESYLKHHQSRQLKSDLLAIHHSLFTIYTKTKEGNLMQVEDLIGTLEDLYALSPLEAISKKEQKELENRIRFLTIRMKFLERVVRKDQSYNLALAESKNTQAKEAFKDGRFQESEIRFLSAEELIKKIEVCPRWWRPFTFFICDR